MALLRPRFQIDDEISNSSFQVTGSGGSTNLVNISGAGLIKELAYSFDQTGAPPPSYDFVFFRMTVDGVLIFNEHFNDTDRITQVGGTPLSDFSFALTGTNDIFDLLIKDVAFLTSFQIQFLNNETFNLFGQMDGATLWHKGA